MLSVLISKTILTFIQHQRNAWNGSQETESFPTSGIHPNCCHSFFMEHFRWILLMEKYLKSVFPLLTPYYGQQSHSSCVSRFWGRCPFSVKKLYFLFRRSTRGRNRCIAEFIKNEVPEQASKHNWHSHKSTTLKSRLKILLPASHPFCSLQHSNSDPLSWPT